MSILILYPSRLVTIPTASMPEKYQISMLDAGVRLGDLFLRVDPILLPALLNAGLKFSKKGFFVSVNVSQFYGDRFVQREDVDRISLDVSGFNLSAGYTFRNLTVTLYHRDYGGTTSRGVTAGLFVRPIMVETGFDSFEEIRFGTGIYMVNDGFFVKLGIASSTRLLKDAKFYVVPIINMGYRK